MECSPVISVIIPTYNRAQALSRCLASLLKQDFRPFEVIICDDGSTDDTRSVADSYSAELDIQYSFEENFGGPARPRNRGIALARGEILAFLDSDDWWAPDKLRVCFEALNKGADIVYHDLYMATNDRSSWFPGKAKTRRARAPVFRDLLERGNYINNSSVMVRRDIVCQADGFTEDKAMIAGEDFDLWLRISHFTDRFCRVDKPLGFYWVGGGNISNPDRTLTICENLEERYYRDARDRFGETVCTWLFYTKGSMLHKLRRYPEAISALSQIKFSFRLFDLYLKSLALLILSTCKERFNENPD